MTVKDYKHFTKAERDQSQKTWVEVLNTYCIADDDGIAAVCCYSRLGFHIFILGE